MAPPFLSLPFLPLACAAVVALAAVPSAAQTCRDQVDRLAAALDLEPTPPTAGSTAPGAPTGDGASGGSVSSERLARSGGVVAPPSTGDGGVIAPPPEAGAAMPTAPAVRPVPGTGASADDTGMTDAARRAQIASLVMAARAAADEGDEARCLSTLQQVRTLTPGGGSTPRSGSGG